MTLFRRISDSIPISISQEPQTEASTQPESQPKINYGVANSADAFETPRQNNLFMDPQFQPAPFVKPPAIQNNTVGISNRFSHLESGAIQLNDQSAKAEDRLNALRKKQEELRSQQIESKTKSLEAHQAAAEIRGARAEGRPIPDALLATLGSLGILGMIGGLPALPIIGGILGSFGLSLDYKRQMERAAAELDKKAGELDMNAENLKSEIEEISKSIEDARAAEQRRQEKLNAPMQGYLGSSSMVQQQAWQAFDLDQNLIKKGNDPLAVPFNPFDKTKDE
jgi:hypothetical protein